MNISKITNCQESMGFSEIHGVLCSDQRIRQGPYNSPRSEAPQRPASPGTPEPSPHPHEGTGIAHPVPTRALPISSVSAKIVL